MKNYRWIIFLIILFNLSASSINAQSNYVLPYPSFMPGNPFYRINLLKDEILKFWYFGNFGEFKYNLKQSDKYLVEAKTLFEYKQYLLAAESLKKSDSYFRSIKPSLLVAKKVGKNITQNLLILDAASEKHIETLQKISGEVPETFLWEPEKSKPTKLNLKELLQDSISVRKSV